MQNLTLSQLLAQFMDLSNSDIGKIQVNELILDSRKVKSGDVFIAMIGHQIDGRTFIPQAIQAGAAAVLADADITHPHQSIEEKEGVAIIYLQDLSQKLSQLSAQVYPYSQMALVGVTGTNGKTTIAQLIAQWAGLIGQKAAVMGTTGNGFLDSLKPAVNTTGSAIEIQQTLSELAKQGAQLTALEVSSHGLVQGRVKALEFDVGIFTNLSRDHLDYHGDMHAYALAKQSLFKSHHCRHCVVNIDDAVGLAWVQENDWNGHVQSIICVSLQSIDAKLRANHHYIYATDISFTNQGIDIEFESSWGKAHFQAPLIGEFNAMNLLCALASLLAQGYALDELTLVAHNLKPVIGRMELFLPTQIATPCAKLVVDYAHTPDALEKALQALRIHCQGQLWCIFGCGGDRDAGKRPMMTASALNYADKLVITDDNPRSEDPSKIVQDMLSQVENPNEIQVIHDRYQACEYALSHANSNDVILIAGKGHEDYQIIGEKRLDYSDRVTAQTLLGKLG